MTRWDQAPEIIELAAELGVGSAAPVEKILDYCRGRIDGWVAEAGGVPNIEALEALVTGRLQMVFEEIRRDDDWERLKEVYARGKKEFVFAGMRTKFDDPDNLTCGALVQRRNVGDDEECLSHWASQGRSLGRRAVVVEARKVPDRVIAIVQPIVEKRRLTVSWESDLFIERESRTE
jgi:hypothetical protein